MNTDTATANNYDENYHHFCSLKMVLVYSKYMPTITKRNG